MGWLTESLLEGKSGLQQTLGLFPGPGETAVFLRSRDFRRGHGTRRGQRLFGLSTADSGPLEMTSRSGSDRWLLQKTSYFARALS